MLPLRILRGIISAAIFYKIQNIKEIGSFCRRLNVLSKSVMPRAQLSIRYILFELEEMEREDNFRLKRFKELKIKKQSKDASDKEEPNKDVKENIAPEPLDKRSNDYKDLGKIDEEQEEIKEVEIVIKEEEKMEEIVKIPIKQNIIKEEQKVKESVKEPITQKVIKAEEMVKESVKEPTNQLPIKEEQKVVESVKEPILQKLIKEVEIVIKEEEKVEEIVKIPIIQNIVKEEQKIESVKEPILQKIKEVEIVIKEEEKKEEIVKIPIIQNIIKEEQKTKESAKEPIVKLNEAQKTDINELKSQFQSQAKADGNAPYFDEPWGMENDQSLCTCPPLFMSTQEVCNAEIPEQTFKVEADNKIQDTKLPKEREPEIPRGIPPCSSEMLLTWLKKILDEVISDCVCNLRKDKKEDIAPFSENIRKYSTEFSKLSIDDSTFSVNSKVEDKLGSYESKYKEIIKVSRYPNEDGTVRQKRKIVTVRTDKRVPMKSKSVKTQNNADNDQNVCTCSDSSSDSEGSKNCEQDNKNDDNEVEEKPAVFYPPTDTRSEPVCSKCLWDKPIVRTCISAGSMKNTKRMNTITCCYPSDRRVNITINDDGCEVHDNLKDTRLPLVSSINVNFCDLPKNVLLDLRDCQGLCNETNEQDKCVIDEDLSKTPSCVPPKKSASTCVCDLENDDIETAEKRSQSFSKVGINVATFKNASTGMTSTAYIFNNVVVTNIKHSSDDRKDTALQSSDFSYIFSKVKKVRHDPLDKKIEESHAAVNTDNFSKECSTRTTMFPYIFSSYQRSEIESMVKKGCFDTPDFPYIFSKTSMKIPCVPCNTKSVEIGDLFNNACKRSYSCTYIFNHLKNIKINAMIKHSCMNKVEFPYIFSTVKTEIEDQPNNDATLRTAEIENMFKNIRKPVTEFTYILNHVNAVKIDNLFKDACKRSEHFPYVFSNVMNETESSNTLQKINIMFTENCKYSCNFPYIFSNATNVNSNCLPCKNMRKVIKEHSYIFSKASEVLKSDGEFKNMCKPKCMLDDELSSVFNNIVFKKSLRNFQQESITRLKEISDLFKESVRSINSGKYKFKYVYKNEVANTDKKTSTDIIYIYTTCDACTSTDNVECGAKKIGVTAVLNQTCNHKSEYTYFPKEVECLTADIVKRASETTLQDIQKIFKDNCNCIFSKITNIDINVPQKEERCNMQCGTSNSTDEVKVDLEKPSEIINIVDINTMFKDSCVRKNEFTYILNKPTNVNPCELARRTTDLRLKQISQFDNAKENASNNSNTIKLQKYEPNQYTKTPNLIQIDNMFKDSCVQKNSFTYVRNNLEGKVSCELARRTSDLRRREIEELSKNSEKITCGYDTCAVCNPDRCLNPNYIKIDKMVKRACKQKNEFTYVLTKWGKKATQLARRTSHLRLHEISKINQSNSSKEGEKKVEDKESSKTDFTHLLRRALESMEMIKSNCEKYRNVATFYDTSMYENDYKYILDKIDQGTKCDLIDCAHLQKTQEINNMIKNSCKMTVEPKYNYIFQKVPKPCVCTCSRKTIALKQPCSVSYNKIAYEEDKPCKIGSQSSCSFLVNKRKNRFLIQIPNTRDDSGAIGIEVMWKSGGVSDKNVAPKCVHITNKRSVAKVSPGTSESTVNKKTSWCPTCNKTDKVPSESNDVSLIRRMLDSVKNVYVPFLKPSSSAVTKEVSQPKADNVISLISNSTTSTYSWKSCVMKTCQAEIECVEKNISYSGFSYGSSLDFVSYKSEGVGSEANSANECANAEESASCKNLKNSNTAERLLTFDIEMKSGSSLGAKDSVISVKSHGIKFDASASDHCQKCGRTKKKPKKACSKCCLGQNRQVYRLSKSPIPSCTRKSKNMLKRSCSFISITSPKYADEPKADYWYNLNKRKKFVCTSTECLRTSDQNVAHTCKQIRKYRSFDDKDCCCSKKS